MKTHKDLEVWKESIELVKQIYEITKEFPKEEVYGLTSQIKRCAVSIPANIAEGAARRTRKEFINFLYISLGSLSELETLLLVAKEVKILSNNNEIFNNIEILRRKLISFIKYVNKKL
jgi:four helix bundle protein